MMKFSKKTLVTVGAAGVLALGIAPATAWAADGSGSASTATSSQGKDRSGQRAEHQQKLSAALAKELGIDQAKVSAALEKVQSQLRPDGKSGDKTADRAQQLKDRLAAAVKAGKLTQAEADAITKAAEAGVLGGHGHSPDRASSSESGK